MKLFNRISLFVFALIMGVLLTISVWLAIRDVKIIAIHQRNNYSDVLVENFPLTDKGKINWWLENKKKIKKKYDIPKPAPYGNFNITFWEFAGRFKALNRDDNLCFENIKSQENCVEKKALLSVWRFGFNDMLFVTYEGSYRLTKDGRVTKIRND